MELIIQDILEPLYPLNIVRWLPQNRCYSVEFFDDGNLSRTFVNYFLNYHMHSLGFTVKDIYFYPDDTLTFELDPIFEE